MLKKRLLATLLTAAMLVTAMAFPAAAEEPTGDSGQQPEYVAQIDSTKYQTLDEAMEAATDGATIELLADCTSNGLSIEEKDLTIQGNAEAKPTISFLTAGICAVKSKLTFKDCKINMVISSNPSESGATANLISNTDLTFNGTEMTLKSDHNQKASGIYLYQESNLYIQNGSKINISEFNEERSSGIYADNSEYAGQPNRNIVIDGASTLTISDCDWHGMTINPINVTVKDYSTVDLTGNGNPDYGGGLGCYYGKLTVENGSTVKADNNKGSSWGIFVKELSLDSTSTISACSNAAAGLTVGGEGTIASGANVILNGNAGSGLWVYSGSNYWYGDVTIENGAHVEIHNNKDGGIYNAYKLNMKAGSITENTTKSYGGGIYNKANAAIANNVVLYNNHAGTAGDDIYNTSTGTITFGKVGTGWALDGAPDCEDAIDGWYDDTKDNRWKAHGQKPYHAEEYTDFDSETGAGQISEAIALKAAHGLKPVDPDDPDRPNWTTSKSKTATNLDSNYESKVTLSLPAAEEELTSDLVFVLDESSCSQPVKDDVSNMLGQLYQQIDNTDAKIKVGAVQFRGEVTQLPLTELTEDTKTVVTTFMSERPETGGSNMNAGLLAAKKMLEADTQVADDRKYVILVSDGITYIWDDDETEKQENYGVNFANGDTPNTPMLAGPDGWDVKHGNGYVPESWATELTSIQELMEKTITEKASLYERGDNATADKPFVAYSEKDEYASTVDIALYKSYQAYQALAEKYHTYAVCSGVESEMNTYPFGPSFMSYLANGQEVSFAQIQKDIYYLLAAGSKVEDYMGYTDGENGYNFDFINDANALTMKVGDTEYKAEVMDANTYGFNKLDDGSYAYTLTYVEGNKQDTEHFVWNINVPVSNFAPVQLTYTVKLTNPQQANGTYGQYDEDGSQKLAGLYTNNSAVLYPVDSDGYDGLPEAFNKPTVSYEITGAPATTTYQIVREYYTKWTEEGDFELDGTVTGDKISAGVGETVTVDPAIYASLNGISYIYQENGSTPSIKTVVDPAQNIITLIYQRDISGDGTDKEESAYQIVYRYYTNGSLTDTVKQGSAISAAAGEEISYLPDATSGYKSNTYKYLGKDYANNTVDTPIQLTVAAGGAENNIIYVDYYRTYSSDHTGGGGGGGGGGSTPSTPSDLDTVNHYAYIIGRDDGLVHPEAEITRAEVATIFFRLLTDDSRSANWAQTNNYSDVSADRWFNHAISTLSKMGIINGYTDGTFKPDQSITRAEFVKMAVSFFHSTYDGKDNFFSDIDGNWAEEYIKAAADIGLVDGYTDGTFRPNNNITRAEAVTIVNNTIGRKPVVGKLLSDEDMITWPDNQNTAKWYYAGMQEATNSHDYTWDTDKTEETWTEELSIRDWAALEREWATNNSSTSPGDVISKQ